MTLWILIIAERAKITVLPIRDKKKKPLFVGELVMQTTATGPRPHKFKVILNNKEEFHPPSELTELLRTADRIMIGRDGDPQQTATVISMLQGFQLSADVVDVCRFCLLKNMFNFLNRRSVRYHREKICLDCARDELTRVLSSSQVTYGEEVCDRLEEVLLGTRDLDRTLLMLNPEELDHELTRFDAIAASTEVSTSRIKELPIHRKFRELLLQKSDVLLPVQSISVKNGLLKGQSQLVTSVTATGKTLIGELAGIENILRKKGKLLYLVPLVALANQKYDQFTERYSGLGIQTSIRVGSARIKVSKTDSMRRSLDSDIIVGTYEGIDYILRTGAADMLGYIGTVVVDEVHTIEDQERGHRLDGVIARLKYSAPDAQFIYLSATVAKPEIMAKHLNAKLIEYEYRPVPIERHLVLCPEHSKIKIMTKLARDEYGKVSSKGHRGQTIIFTNSRRNCHRISEALSIPSAPYHAGLTSQERKKVEVSFAKGRLPVVVTTAALAAGVDFPASQVMFESLAMGIEWLNMQEFLQMLGRAGRPDYHDRGEVVLLASPGKRYTGDQGDTEDTVALKLLKGEMLHTRVDYGEEEKLEEILATAAVTSSEKDLRRIHGNMLADYNVDVLLRRLEKQKFLQRNKGSVELTRFGKIAAGHFLSVSRAFLIRDAVLLDQGPLNIVTNLEFFDGVYFKYASRISATLNVNLPSRVFQGASLDILFEGENMGKLDIALREQLFDFASEFLTCTCKDSPYCGCAERKFSEKIITIRTEGYDPAGIVRKIENLYGVTAYPGDVLGYLDSAVRNLDAVEMIAKAYSKKEIALEAHRLKKEIEG
ncbi:DEAD/DEAH box helicase [Methanolobus chelungpuianus]|uniref:DEAD/DEAH box helicase n=1 Tax=Methanolobus chelungpuianus TaxID=502115 RepID=A0AAE3HC18_9EURY|nr:DEAD/DEAH box helicase [Methanolobus chelungpuianus]MCQ6963490.1 DEAD/DEAH box helicase [Methanolobus chelungpuianus]